MFHEFEVDFPIEYESVVYVLTEKVKPAEFLVEGATNCMDS